MLELLAIGLAGWRLTMMLNRETGPFDIFVHARSLLGFKHDDAGKPIAWPDTMLAKLVSCPWCLAVWVAPVMYGVWRIEADVVLVIAAMAIAGALDDWIQRK